MKKKKQKQKVGLLKLFEVMLSLIRTAASVAILLLNFQ